MYIYVHISSYLFILVAVTVYPCVCEVLFFFQGLFACFGLLADESNPSFFFYLFFVANFVVVAAFLLFFFKAPLLFVSCLVPHSYISLFFFRVTTYIHTFFFGFLLFVLLFFSLQWRFFIFDVTAFFFVSCLKIQIFTFFLMSKVERALF